MKISVVGIVTGHINSLRSFRTGKIGLEGNHNTLGAAPPSRCGRGRLLTRRLEKLRGPV